jgi:hypothetical protein
MLERPDGVRGRSGPIVNTTPDSLKESENGVRDRTIPESSPGAQSAGRIKVQHRIASSCFYRVINPGTGPSDL